MKTVKKYYLLLLMSSIGIACYGQTYDWIKISKEMQKIERKIRGKKGAKRAHICRTMNFNPIELFNCQCGDTIYFEDCGVCIQSGINGYLIWINSNTDSICSVDVRYYNPQVKEVSWYKLNFKHTYDPTVIFIQLVLNWDIKLIVEESEISNTYFPSIHENPRHWLYRIILQENGQFHIDYATYKEFQIITKDFWEIQKEYYQETNQPIPEIDDKYIH